MARSNALFGGRRAVLAALDAVFDEAGGAPLTLLDVGTGVGDVPYDARRRAARRGARLETFGVELNPALAAAGRARVGHAVCADAFRLPFADRSVDVVTCSQVAHHFEGPALLALLREVDRVARRRVVVADLRRSYVAAAGFWAASRLLRFHPVTQHDGVVSVFRGFTAGELAELVARATGAAAPERLRVRHALGWRVVAVWAPSPAAASAARSAADPVGTPAAAPPPRRAFGHDGPA